MQTPSKTVGANVVASPLKTPLPLSQSVSESNDHIAAFINGIGEDIPSLASPLPSPRNLASALTSSSDDEAVIIYSESDSEIEFDTVDEYGLCFEDSLAFNTAKLVKVAVPRRMGSPHGKAAAKRCKKAALKASSKAQAVDINAARATKMAAREGALPEVVSLADLVSPSVGADATTALAKNRPTAAVSRAVAVDAAAAAAGIRKILPSKDSIFNRCQHVSPSLPRLSSISEGWNMFGVLAEEIESALPPSPPELEYYGGSEIGSASDSDYEFDYHDVLGISFEDMLDPSVSKGQHRPAKVSSKAAAEENKATAHKAQGKKAKLAVESGRTKKVAAVEASLPPVEPWSSPAAAAPAATPVASIRKEAPTTKIESNASGAFLSFDDSNCTRVQPSLPGIAAIPVDINMFAALGEICETPAASECAPREGLFIRAFRFVGGMVAGGLAAAKTLAGAVKQLFGRKK